MRKIFTIPFISGATPQTRHKKNGNIERIFQP